MKLTIDRVIPDFGPGKVDIFFNCEGENFSPDALRDCYRRYGAVACYFGGNSRPRKKPLRFTTTNTRSHGKSIDSTA